ncbi:MAG: Holliday junction resolvase RuvX [Bacteroidetes bacterium]|nr:Holliday junction resolvase RuvX [Bacteroidota bacterium]MBK9402383.1 Holliday junction resolvase RuvX [Bacteroidota bacterium]
MGRIIAVDYGSKRCGLAVTDPTQTIATALESLPTTQLVTFLLNYLKSEVVDTIVLGEPKRLNNTNSSTTLLVHEFAERLRKDIPNIPIVLYDERFTSKIAFNSLIESGQSRKVRKDKTVLDRISATLLLQDFLNSLLSKK